MIAVYVILGVFLLLLLLRFLFRGRIPKYNGISKSDLSRYFAYLLQNALADGGTVHVEPEDFKAAVNVTKHEHLKKPRTISVKLSSGYVTRTAIADASNAMLALGYECKLRYTKSRRVLHSLTISLSGNDSFTPSAVVDVISKIFDAVGARDARTYSVFVYGPLTPGFLPEDGDVVKRSSRFVVGWAIGSVVGRIWRMMRGA